MSVPAAARKPVAVPAATLPGVIIAVTAGALGVAGVHDGLVATGAVSGTAWASAAADAISGATPQTWMLPVGAVAALVGLWLVIAALKPRRQTALPLASESAVWIAPRDLARIAASSAAGVPGVTRSSAKASRRSVTVTVAGSDPDLEALKTHIRDAVASHLDLLQRAPTLRVRATAQRASR